MSDPIIFIVDGNPIAKQSFRYAIGGGYQSSLVTTWQHTIAWRAKEAMREREPITGIVGVRLVFVLTNRRTVDVDNLSKAVLDGLKGIAFADDNQVVNLHVVKHVFIKGHAGVMIEIHEGGELPPFYEVKNER